MANHFRLFIEFFFCVDAEMVGFLSAQICWQFINFLKRKNNAFLYQIGLLHIEWWGQWASQLIDLIAFVAMKKLIEIDEKYRSGRGFCFETEMQNMCKRRWGKFWPKKLCLWWTRLVVGIYSCLNVVSQSIHWKRIQAELICVNFKFSMSMRNRFHKFHNPYATTCKGEPYIHTDLAAQTNLFWAVLAYISLIEMRTCGICVDELFYLRLTQGASHCAYEYEGCKQRNKYR